MTDGRKNPSSAGSSILAKLHAIEDRKCIYNIHYCKAGVGITFYDPEKDFGSWELALVTHKYYPSFEDCIEAEYNALRTT